MQGKTAADSAVSALTTVDLQGSITYLDIESYTVPAGDTTCSPAAVRNYVNNWVAEMHAKGYQAGVYGSPGNINSDMTPGAVANVPDQIWAALWNNAQNVSPLPPIPNAIG